MIYAKNLPVWERVLRTLAGCLLVAWGWSEASSTLLLAAASAAGICLIVTSLVGFCPGCATVGRRPVGS